MSERGRVPADGAAGRRHEDQRDTARSRPRRWAFPTLTGPAARRRLAAAVAVWLVVAWSGPPPGAPAPAAAATAGVAQHRAAVIIDTGTEVKSVCVRFQEESLSGIDALARAQVDPVVQAFSGKGAAVCALCGVGCPAGDSCLTCNPEGRFWSYSRAPAGATSLRVSPVGASSTTVYDGDVEGWRWALGGAPPFRTVEQVCGESAAAPETTAPAPAPPAVATTAAGAPATATSVASSATTATTRQGAVATTTGPAAPVTAAPSTSDTTAPPGSDRADAPAPAGGGGAAPSGSAARPTSAHGAGEGGSPAGLALFAAVLTGLVAWGGRARRARRRAEDGR